MKRPNVILALLFLLCTCITSAQGDIPLVGPVVAAVPAAQDRIILYDLGGGAQRELSFGGGWHNLWGFSPDGCQVLYTLTDTSGLGRAYTANIDGTGVHDLVFYTDLPADRWGVWEPQWSPTSSVIAFTMLRDGFEGSNERQYHVGWVDASPESDGVPQFYSVSGQEHTPLWSPDGQWLAYVSYEERVAGADIMSTAEPTAEPPPGQQSPTLTTLNEADIWVVGADGANKFQLTNFPVGSVSMPRWSPDSAQVGFVHSPSPSNDTLWLIAAQSGAIPKQLSFQWSLILDLAWMPDSAEMLAAARDFHETRDNRLWRVPLVGDADIDSSPLIEPPLPEIAHTDYPRFSADGRWLAFRNTYALTVIDWNTDEIVLLDDARPGNTPPVWTPSGFHGESACETN